MVEPTILETNLTAIESQRQEEFWLNDFISKGYKMLNKASTGINKSSLGAVMKWNYEKCKEVAKECYNKEEFKKKYGGVYNLAKRKGWLCEFFENVKKPNGYWNNLENCIEESKKYQSLKELSIKCGSCYNIVRKNKWQKYLKR